MNEKEKKLILLENRLERYEEELSEYISLVNLRKSYIVHVKKEIEKLKED